MIRVLIVDDSATSRLLFRAHMPKEIECEIHEASNLEQALEKENQISPDVIILDYNMPDNNGVEIANQLSKTGTQARYVLLTANTQRSVVDAAMAAGFVSVVEKPITAEKLKTMLEGLDI